MGQALSSENWCVRCQCIDHMSIHCQYRPHKTTWASAFSQPVKPEPQICIKYNRYNGDCKFVKDCWFKHACSSYGEPHPSSKCPCGGKDVRAGPSAGVLWNAHTNNWVRLLEKYWPCRLQFTVYLIEFSLSFSIKVLNACPSKVHAIIPPIPFAPPSPSAHCKNKNVTLTQ